MLRKTMIALSGAAALTLLSTPTLAQDEMGQDEFAAIAAMFEVEPLTAEQEARLPLATQIVGRVLPEGAMMEVMGSMFERTLGPVMAMANEDTGAALTGALGYSADELAVSNETSAEILAIVDPAWRERNAAITNVTQAMMADMMTQMEPIVRDVMAELYAIYFTESELVDIDAFFSTPSGLRYARESYAMAGDPRIMSAMFSNPEIMFGMVNEMPAKMEQALADVPAARGFDELSSAEQARVMALTGLSKAELRDGMAAAAQMHEGGM
ncbi:DUF2059 domain-containing protein [Aurantiacibacter odishensis]|uniref:DUF2059 domain-containing protein n=1 Tax=Aurantiacibacter odishensis TaxID=1155476 RepID=UPI000E7150BF|nr:DUF2059 domain-containing protein [Aurantiacibacter odishensis]